MGKVEVEKDKILKDGQKAHVLGLHTGADTLWQRVAVEESWGCRWLSSPPRLSGVSIVVTNARARGGRHRVVAVVVALEVARARELLSAKS